MSGDLEDFLRRAAQRRQAKTAPQRSASPPGRKNSPQYSNRRTERTVRPAEADEILVAELVEDEEESLAARARRVQAAKKAAAEAEAQLAVQQSRGASQAAGASPGNVVLSGNPAQDLIRLLRQPTGIQQAILLKEILDRPEHRW